MQILTLVTPKANHNDAKKAADILATNLARGFWLKTDCMEKQAVFPQDGKFADYASSLMPVSIFEIVFNTVQNAEKLKSIYSYLRSHNDLSSFDWCLQPFPKPKRRLIVTDMDSTVVRIETLDSLAYFASVGEEVVKITDEAMAGGLDFVNSLSLRLNFIAGKPAIPLFSAVSSLIYNKLTPGAKELIALFKHQGGKSALVTGGFDFAATLVSNLLDIDEFHANNLEIDEHGKLTGNVLGRIIDGKAKASILSYLANAHDFAPEETIAMGDGANDRMMMEKAGLSIAYHPKPILRDYANAIIQVGDLSSVIYFLELVPLMDI